MNWSEVRQYVRKNPGKLKGQQHDYVREYVKRRKLGNPNWDHRLESQWRRLAILNFYRQVVGHPEMRDLSLRVRQRGDRSPQS